MGKRQVIARFVTAAVVWLVLAAIVAEQLPERAGQSLVALAVLLVGAAAWGSFAHNSRLFGRVLGTGSASKPWVALTFDDGPDPRFTPALLDTLAGARVRATFFCLGRAVRDHPELARRIVDDGHELASHGDDHGLLVFAGPREIARQLREAESAIQDASGDVPSRLFRPPHGFRNPFVVRVARQLGYQVVGWTGSVFDTARPGVQAIVDRCSRLLQPGAILLLHDGDGAGRYGDRAQTVAAVPGIVAAAHDRGLEFVTVSELASDLLPQRRRLLRSLAMGLALVAIVFALSRKFSLGVVADVFTQADFEFVALALLANLVSVGFKALTWQAALHAIEDDRGERHIAAGIRDVVPAIFIGFLFNTLLFARLGELARVTVLRRRLAGRGIDLSFSTGIGTLVTEQLLAGATLVGVLVSVVLYVPVPRQAVNLLAVLSGVVIAIAAVAAGIEIWTRFRHRGEPEEDEDEDEDDYVERWWHLLGISVTATIDSLRQGQTIVRRPKLLAWATFTSALCWLAQLAGIYWTLKAYGLPLGVGAAGVVFLASNLVQLFPITPGNLGVFQGVTALGLTSLYNVDVHTALTFSIGLQLIESLLAVGLGFVFLSLEGLSVGALRDEVEQERAPSAA
jgi:peptidoglycan-N-acetylglucosamine deacetylase